MQLRNSRIPLKRFQLTYNNISAQANSDFYESNVKSILRKLSFCNSTETQIITLLSAIEAKDPYTKGHSESVAYYSKIIGMELGLSSSELDTLQFAAFLHDVGKIMIDRRLLLKPALLNETESKIIKKHPEIGSRILSNLQIEKVIVDAVLHHHERWDGSGYPSRLFAYEIPLFARILAISDTFDALTSNRPYREAIDIRKAKMEIYENSGQQFDPDIVKAFLKVLKENSL